MAKIRQRAFPPGVYRGVPYSRERLREFIDGTNKALQAGVQIPLLNIHAPIDCDDKTTQQFTGDQGRGWLTKVEPDPTDGAVVFEADNVPDDTAKAIIDGTLKLTSPEIRHRYKSDDGAYEGKIFRHFAFTPKSGTTKQGPIEVMALSEAEIPSMQLSEEDYEGPVPAETEQFAEANEKKRVKEALHGEGHEYDDPSEHTYSGGHHTIRHSFFYRHGGDSQQHANKVSEKLHAAGIPHTVVDHGEHNAPFRGGANTKQSSHWWVKVKVHKPGETTQHSDRDYRSEHEKALLAHGWKATGESAFGARDTKEKHAVYKHKDYPSSHFLLHHSGSWEHNVHTKSGIGTEGSAAQHGSVADHLKWFHTMPEAVYHKYHSQTTQHSEFHTGSAIFHEHGWKKQTEAGGVHTYAHPDHPGHVVNQWVGSDGDSHWEHQNEKGVVGKGTSYNSMHSHLSKQGLLKKSSQHAEPTTQHIDYGVKWPDNTHGVLINHGYVPKHNNAYEYEHKGGMHRVILSGVGTWHHSTGTKTGSATAQKMGHGWKDLKEHLTSIHGESSQHSESTDSVLAAGTKVHLGFGSKGGAGFRGKVIKHEGSTVHIESPDGRTYKGPHRFVTVEDGPKASQHSDAYAAHPDMGMIAATHGWGDGERLRQVGGVHKYVHHHPDHPGHVLRHGDGAWEHFKHGGADGRTIVIGKGRGVSSLHTHMSKFHGGTSQHAEEIVFEGEPATETEQFGESFHNIENKKLMPHHDHYVGYGNGVWNIRKYGSGATTWRATHREGKHPPKTAATLKEISQHLDSIVAKHGAAGSSQHEEQPVSETSQHGEDIQPHHEALLRHGYHLIYGEANTGGRNIYGHKKLGHSADVYPNGGWTHYGPTIKTSTGHAANPISGHGHEGLAHHLSMVHGGDIHGKATPPPSQHAEPPMKTDPTTEAAAETSETTEQFAEGGYASVLAKHGYSLGSSNKRPDEGMQGMERNDKVYMHPHESVPHVVLTPHPAGKGTPSWSHWTVDHGYHSSGGNHTSLDQHLSKFHKGVSQHAEDDPPPKKVEEPKADESTERPPAEVAAEGPTAANPDMPPVATDKSKMAAFISGMAQLGVVLPSDFDLNDEHALDLLITGINTQCKAKADAESEPEEPKEPNDTEANPTWAFSEAELEALPLKAKEAYAFAVKARQEQQAKAAQFAEEARTLAQEKADLARSKAFESIKVLKMLPGLRNKLLDMLAPGTAQFTDQGEQPSLTVQQVAVLIADSIPPSMALTEEDGTDAEHQDTKQFFEANKIVKPGTEGRPQTREEARALITKVDEDMGMRPRPKTNPTAAA